MHITLWLYSFCIALSLLGVRIVHSQFSIQQTLPSTCETPGYFDFGALKCVTCGAGMRTDSTGYSCTCLPGYKADINNVRVLTCTQCSSAVTTPDGYFCASCQNSVEVDGQCTCSQNEELIIDPYIVNGDSIATCSNCSSSFLVNTGNPNCVPCPECCLSLNGTSTGDTYGGLCFNTTMSSTLQDITIASTSDFIRTNLAAAYGACISNPSLRNQTACEQLSNMCVMQQYKQSESACVQYQDVNGGTFDIAGGIEWQDKGIPWLYYATTANDAILNDDEITSPFSFDLNAENNRLDFVVAQYRANGTFIGYSSVENGLIQICKDNPTVMNAAYQFGTTFISSCVLDATTLWNDDNKANVYFDMFLRYTLTTGDIMLHPVPVLVTNYEDVNANDNLVNTGSNSGAWQFVRRFFLIDNVYGVPDAGAQATQVRYARSMDIQIRFQPSSASGSIYPPILRMSYETVESDVLSQNNPTVQATFSVTYTSSTTDQNEGIKISMSILGVLAFLYAAIETSGWRRRQGLPYIELTTLLQFFLYFMGNVANVFFVVMLGYTTVLLIFFKGQNSATNYVPTNDSYQNYLFIVFVSVAFACKLFQVVIMTVKQAFVDIFLIDWERPRAKSADDGSNKVSIWRTYFIANEWNEIQTFRKINTTFQLFAVLLFLEVVGFKNLALLNSSGDLNPSSDAYEPPSSRMLRFAISGLVYVIVALIQVIYFKFIHERFISDQIRDFVDLCSVSNVSIFILSQNNFGYYIHGRSVHGRADTDMAEMSLMLKREEQNLVSTRGLITGTENQVFEITIPTKMRQQYDKIYQPLHLMRAQPGARGPNTRGENVTSESMKAYNTMKTFLTAFIDHSLRDLDYIVTEKMFLEKIVGIEFQEPVDKAFFRVDDGNSFADILFYGREVALIVFDILLFSLVDYGATNYVLAAIITYLVAGVLKTLRGILGRHNLAKKTLIDKRFLI